MKKYNLLKVLGITFLILVVLSWIVVPGTLASGKFVKADATAPLGLFDLFRTPIITIGTFFNFGLVLLTIGGFYGVIKKTGVYEKIIQNFVNKFKGKDNVFLIIVLISLIVLSSLTGLSWVLFILVPFLAAVLLKLGYGKLTTLAATVGSILIGSMGSTYGFGINGFVINIFGIKDVNYQILTKIIFLVAISILYVLFVVKSANKGKETKKVKTTKNSKTKKETIKEEKETKVVSKKQSNKSIWPLITVVLVSIILLLMGSYNFFYSFGLECFQNMHEAIMDFELGGYPIFANLIGNLGAIGDWTSIDLCIFLVLTSILISLIYRIKFTDAVEGFASGAKEMLAPALYVTLANIIFTFVMTTGTGYTICDTFRNMALSISKDFNAFVTALTAGIGSLFYNDFYYLLNTIAGYYATTFTDKNVIEATGIIYQVVYGFFMLFLPTSVILIAGLSYLKVSYKEWLKYIWKLLLALLAVIITVIVVFACLV